MNNKPNMNSETNTPIFISLTGKMRSGKDTVAEMMKQTIKEKYCNNDTTVKLFAFGDAVKQITYSLFPSPVKNRDKLQKVGQKMREIDENVWINVLDNSVQSTNKSLPLGHSNLVAIITDVRQPNEYNYAYDKGCIVKIISDEETRLKRIQDKGEEVNYELLNHETESHIDGYKTDFVVYNNGDLESLYKQVENLVTAVFEEVN